MGIFATRFPVPPYTSPEITVNIIVFIGQILGLFGLRSPVPLTRPKFKDKLCFSIIGVIAGVEI